MPEKLEAVLVRLARSSELNMTKAVKLPYLVDVLANQILGRPITGAHHQAWKEGVVASEVWHLLDKASDTDPLHVESVHASEEKRLVVSEECDDAILDPAEMEIVDAIADFFSGMSATELGTLTKRMNPAVSNWGTNHRAGLSQDQFDRMSSDYQAMVDLVLGLSLYDLENAEYLIVDDPEDAVA